MPDQISRQRLKKKVLERWENEGGKLYADPTGTVESGPPEKCPGKGTAVKGSERPIEVRPKKKK